MRNHMKILCVVLALIVALSAASCSLSKQYSFKTDDVELPIGVYINYLRSAYYEAQSYAQKSDKYDSAAGTYDGSKSFLKLEITDDDGVTAVAEDWIKDRALHYMNEAVAVYYEYNKLGATMDEATYITQKSIYDQYKDTIDSALNPYGISYESFLLCTLTIPLMREAVFKAEYGVGGPMAVSDEELHKFFEEKYSSYHYFTANLYATADEATVDESGAETTTTVTNPLPQAEIDALISAFDGYAAELEGGASFTDILDKYNTAYGASATATDKVQIVDEDTEDDTLKEVIALAQGGAKQYVLGDTDTTRKIYLLYKDVISDATEKYFETTGNRDEVLAEYKSDDFTELLKTIAAAMTIDKSSAINDYKPSMFE